jgi:hypothetical protein
MAAKRWRPTQSQQGNIGTAAGNAVSVEEVEEVHPTLAEEKMETRLMKRGRQSLPQHNLRS